MNKSDPRSHRPPSFLPGRCMTPPACFPLREEPEYARLCHVSGRRNGRKRSYWVRNFLWKLLRDGKNMGSLRNMLLNNNANQKKAISFKYDAVSYSQNFDEGCHNINNHDYDQQLIVLERIRKRSLVINCPDDDHVVRWDLQIPSSV